MKADRKQGNQTLDLNEGAVAPKGISAAFAQLA
jgi:hypothetical protein